uniref:Rho-GAP domain-containing protein n=1 Tax=Arcella intermedia TaxID=1963864 RepID=A0A6B2L7M5_9EUKA
MFGVPLSEAASKSDKPNGAVPSVIYKAVQYINQKALKEEGLYRVPGSEETYLKYKARFDAGEDVSLEGELLVENVTLLVIKYLKALPESLFTNALHDLFKKTIEIENKEEQLKQIGVLCGRLPYAHRETIHLLVDHFIKIIQNSQFNKMDGFNITTTLNIIFGRTLARIFEILISHPDLCPSSILFGLPLVEAAAISDPLKLIPSPMRLCIDEIEKRNAWEPDLYIASGSWIMINRFKDKFNRGDTISFEDVYDIDIITGIIKLYIFDLPENLVTWKLKPEIQALLEYPDGERPALIKAVLAKLPPPNYASLEKFVVHLYKVVTRSNGGVTPLNVGSVFGGFNKILLPLLIQHAPALFNIN